jgi:3-hydroxyisobutyrate dehydrogenase-like beta-hydroxyacid dehydrogenase
MPRETIGLVGLGLLGTALSERLLQAGFAVAGFDIDPERLRLLAGHGGQPLASACDAARACDRVLLSLPDSAIAESVLNEMAAEFRAGLSIVDTTTGDPERTAVLGAALAQKGVHYLDATVSGSSEAMRRGEAVLMVGGEQTVSEACADLFTCLARSWYYLGPWGSGARMKLVVNLVLGLNRAALAEGLALARAERLDLSMTLQVLQDGAAYSRAMDTKGRKMIERDFTPQGKLSQHLKDVRLILAEAERVGAKAPLSTLHLHLLRQIEAAGYGGEDNAAVMKAYD